MIHIGPIMHHLGNPSHYQQLYLERRIGVLKRYATSKPFPFRSIINGVRYYLLLMPFLIRS